MRTESEFYTDQHRICPANVPFLPSLSQQLYGTEEIYEGPSTIESVERSARNLVTYSPRQAFLSHSAFILDVRILRRILPEV